METTLLDVKIHYEQIGDRGPCVLFLHGWGCSIRHFEPIMQAMADGYRLYAIDFPAHGQSGRPPVPWGVDDFARLTEAFIQERGIAPATLSPIPSADGSRSNCRRRIPNWYTGSC